MVIESLLQNFHFLRPWWFLALLPALALCWLKIRQQNSGGEWSTVIAAELLPYLLDGATGKRRNLTWAWLLGWLLAVIALSGPTWRQIPLPVHKQEQALVILFDLSPSMLARDITPDRLTRARLKLVDILNQRREGTTALVAYAGEAYTVSPLTDDAKTVAALVPALHPGIMPTTGSNTEAAVNRAIELLSNAGHASGDLLIISDGITPQARQTIDRQLRDKLQVEVSILGVGTEQGAPIPLGNGSFAKDRNGAIVVPTLDGNALKKLARRLGGHYTELTADDRDINYLLKGLDSGLDQELEQLKVLERTFDSWDDQGFWLALLCLPLLLLSFRRGVVASMLIIPLLSAPQQSHALSWQDLWQRPDQQASEAFQRKDYAAAQQLFKNQQWQAAAAYKNGDHQSAAALFNNDTAIGDYNRGNALAKLGKYREAIEAYQQALAKQPEFPDAQFNRDLLEQLLQQQKQKQEQQQQPGQNDPNDKAQQNKQQQPGEQQNSQQQNSGENEQQPSQQSQQHSQARDQQQAPQKEHDSQQPQQNEQQSPPLQNDKPPEQQQAEQTDTQEQQQADQTQASQQPLNDEEKQAMEQWLRRIPDDPGGLLREKFRYKHEQRRQGFSAPKPETEQRW